MGVGGIWSDRRAVVFGVVGCTAHSVISPYGWLERAVGNSTNRSLIGQLVAFGRSPCEL